MGLGRGISTSSVFHVHHRQKVETAPTSLIKVQLKLTCLCPGLAFRPGRKGAGWGPQGRMGQLLKPG